MKNSEYDNVKLFFFQFSDPCLFQECDRYIYPRSSIYYYYNIVYTQYAYT